MHVELTYDADGDVLYASIGRPTPCTSRDVGDGVLVRHDAMTGDIVATTLVSARSAVAQRRDSVLEKLKRVPRPLHEAISAWMARMAQ